MTTDGLYSIAEVARSFGLSVATLRYYEEQGLVEPSARIGRVRHYDRDQLIRLSYALIWHRDAGMTIEQTRRIIESRHSQQRHELIAGHVARIAEQIDALHAAQATLEHLLTCPADDPQTCPHTGAELRRRVAAALGPEL